MHLFNKHNWDWQWGPWHLPWFHKTEDMTEEWRWWEYWFGVGPFQFRFRGKPWSNWLRRSPEYSEALKKILLEDLNNAGYR